MLRPTTDRTRTRARHRWARGAFLRLEVLALVVVALCLAVLSSSSTPARAELELTSGPGDSLTLSNDKEGAAILSLGGMRPGDSVTDTVTLGNTGTVPGDLSLSTSNLLDTPGAGGGAIAGELDLVIRDITNAGSPVTVYSGKIDALTPLALGTLAAAASRVYEFRASFPDAGAGAENAFQGSAVSVQFDWTAVNNDADTDPPETTITSGPASLSASPDATFAFTSDESGSTFECSLDGSAFACSSPAAYTGLGDGAHTFDVRATDSSANTDATPAGASWTIDATAPTKPRSFSGSRSHGRLKLKWKAATDNGVVGAYLVYANGKVVRTLAGSRRSVTLGRFKTSDSRAFQVAARDSAGNVGLKTRALVVVPGLMKLTLAQAKSRLVGRGLRAGAVRYSYSTAIGAGKIISARSGVAFKDAAVGLKVSRGPLGRTSYSIPTGTSGGTSSGGTSYGASGYGGTRTQSPSSSGGRPTQTGSGDGSPVSSESGGSSSAPAVEPQSFTPADEDKPSGLRRALGLALLGGAFAAAGGIALRARRPRPPRPVQSDGTVEPLLFWDDRLVHAVTASVRRITGRF
jgi:hypothetical protein